MSMPARVEELLKAQHVSYRTIVHRHAPTSQEVAHASLISGWNVAKVLALRDAHGGWLLAVVPAPLRVDLEALGSWTDAHSLRLATESEISVRFPDCDPGALPPFERLHDVPVFVDDSFADDHDIYFEDGSHQRLVGIRVQDFIRVADPTIGHFSNRARQGH